MKRLFRMFASLTVAVVLATGVARSQVQPWRVPSDELQEVAHSRFYRVTYQVSNQSIWGPGPGGFDVNRTFTLQDFGVPPPSANIGYGGYFTIPFLGEFGAFIGATVSATPSLTVNAGGSVGDVDVTYPMDVFIRYPRREDLRPFGAVFIETRFYPDRTAAMHVQGPNLFAKVIGGLDADIQVGINAKAFSEDLIDINLFQLLGLPNPHFGQSMVLVDSTQLSLEGEYEIIPNIVSVGFHFPNLSGTGVFDSPGGNRNALHAGITDNFLTVTANVTNAIVQAFGIPPLNGSYGSDEFGGSFSLLDLRVIGSVGVGQDLVFDPRPLITFNTDDGQSVTVRAGETARLQMPFTNSLAITPTICANAFFSNRTGLRFTPTIDFNLIKLEAHGEVADITLLDFNWEPFHPIVSPFEPFSIPLLEPSFDLPQGECIVGDSFVLTGSSLATLEIRNFPKLVPTQDTNMPITGNAAGVSSDTRLFIDDQDAGPVQPTGNDNFTAVIPQRYLARPGTHQASLFTLISFPDGELEFKSNAVTFFVQPRPLPPTAFGPIQATQPQGAGEPQTLIAGADDIRLRVRTAPFVHRGAQVEDITEGTTLFYNGEALPTTITPITATATSNGVPVYTTVYDLEALVPLTLQLRGGTHNITLAVPAINTPEAQIGAIHTLYPRPRASAFTLLKTGKPQKSTADNPYSDNRRAVVSGTGFTPDSFVKWDGDGRPTQCLSQTQLLVQLKNDDLKRSGNHAVSVVNPEPGGGQSNTLTHVVAPKGPPRIQVIHNLHQEPGNMIGNVMSVKNVGVSKIERLEVKRVKVVSGLLEHDCASGVPAKLPATIPGGKNSLLLRFEEAHFGLLRLGIIKVFGEADGVAFEDYQLVRLP